MLGSPERKKPTMCEPKPIPTYQEARAFVSNWLFESRDRKSGGMSWQSEHCEDAAQMIVQFFKDRAVKQTTTPESEQFHREWGEAAMKPDYNKQAWLDRQRELQARGVPA